MNKEFENLEEDFAIVTMTIQTNITIVQIIWNAKNVHIIMKIQIRGEMMERLTEKQSSGYDLKVMNGEWCNKYCEKQIAQTCNECGIYQAIQKLAEYEDLEEQGLLLRLPCKAGDKVFKLKQHNYCPAGICRKVISCSECRANTPFGVVEG